MAFAVTWIIILSEVSQKEKDKYHMMLLICGILKYDTNECTKTNRHTDKENKLMVTKRKEKDLVKLRV